jgi:DHA1 family bicyclomycin/chloramphenicol resistance-like MFS transporter
VADQARPVREPMSATTLLWLVTGCMMLQPLSTDLYLASLPGMALDFGVSPAAVQQTLSLFVFGFGTAQLISGPLSDRYGRRPVLIGGLALYLVSGLACALAPSLGWLIAARFVQAIGCCTAVVVARAIIRDAYSPAEGARVMARALSLLALAPILGPILGGYLQVAFGWRAAFVTLALSGLAMWVASLRHLTESNPSSTRTRCAWAILPPPIATCCAPRPSGPTPCPARSPMPRSSSSSRARPSS